MSHSNSEEEASGGEKRYEGNLGQKKVNEKGHENIKKKVKK